MSAKHLLHRTINTYASNDRLNNKTTQTINCGVVAKIQKDEQIRSLKATKINFWQLHTFIAKVACSRIRMANYHITAVATRVLHSNQFRVPLVFGTIATLSLSLLLFFAFSLSLCIFLTQLRFFCSFLFLYSTLIHRLR